MLSLFNTVALLVYLACKSVLVTCYCSPCLLTVDKESNSVRQGHPSIYWKKNTNFYTHASIGKNTHRKKAESLILRRHTEKFANQSSKLGFFTISVNCHILDIVAPSSGKSVVLFFLKNIYFCILRFKQDMKRKLKV